MKCGDDTIDNDIDQKINGIMNELKNMKPNNDEKFISLNVLLLIIMDIHIYILG